MRWKLTLALLVLAGATSAEDPARTTVGMPARLRALVLPGPELEVAPAAAHDPIVLRITAVYPHGTAHRYDFEVWGYEPGEYDLRAYLRRKDDGALEGEAALPPIPLRIDSVLAPGQVKPHAPGDARLPAVGGYRALWIAGGLAWLAGLVAILFVGRKRRRAEAEQRARPRTLAERLRPLVQRALAGELSRVERAQLESSLVAYWRRRLDLEAERPDLALSALHEHAEAGPLLRGLEDWLHRPAPPAGIDLATLLAPYRELPADALELPEAAPAATNGRTARPS